MSPALVRLTLSNCLGVDIDNFNHLEHGNRWYNNGMVGPGGMKIWWGARAKGMNDIAVEISGDGCEALGWDKLIWVMQWASQHEAHFSRCDTGLDDYSRSVTPEDVRAACKGPDRLMVSHARKGGLYVEDDFETDSEVGHGFRVGSGSGRRFIRVYDKGEESKGEKNCIRWEEQHRDAAAEMVVAALAKAGPVYGQRVVLNFLVSFADFRLPTYSRKTDRPRAEWYERLVGDAVRCRTYPAIAPKGIREKCRWSGRQWPTTVAVLLSASGGDLSWVSWLAQKGEEKLKSKNRRIIREAQELGGLKLEWFQAE
jgi:DNA relaxase NicK